VFCEGPGINDEEEFECFCQYGNRVSMDDAEFATLKAMVDKHLPRKPLYVCTINKSNIVKGKGKMVKISFSVHMTCHIYITTSGIDIGKFMMHAVLFEELQHAAHCTTSSTTRIHSSLFQ
jgi:hypothetical protein